MTRPLSGPEFVQSVLDLKPHIAVFDCDGTLWGGDSGAEFFYWEIEQGLIPRQVADWALPRYDDYKAGKVGEEEMCGEMVTIHAGIPVARIESAAQEFFEQKKAIAIYPVMQELTMELRSHGCDLWAVSSTNDWVVRVGARRFGICDDHVLAACVAVEGGCASGRLIHVPSGEGKARAIREHVPGGRPDIAFGNSVHDLEMLALAQHAFAINPDARLETAANKRGWVIHRTG
jgi:HAD superfamily phosphoserine phosphatase-like hydrolase